MRTVAIALASVFAVGLLAAPSLLQEKGGEEETGPYAVVENWPATWSPKGYIWGSQPGVFAETPNRIFIAARGELKLPETLPRGFNGIWGSLNQRATEPKPEMRNCIVIVDGDGKLVESWTQWDKLFEGGGGPHKIRINPHDPEKHVWVVNDARHQIYEFTNDGKQLVLTLGVADVAGEDATHFGRPQDIAWLPDSSLLVADGLQNARIAKFDKSGKFLMAWGSKGTASGQFSGVHGIAVDRNRRVYVADRTNHRIQIFDENGKLLDLWPGFRQANDILIAPDQQHVWVADGTNSKVLEYDMNGKLLYSWGTYGTFPGQFWELHQMSIDSEGNLYGADSFGGRTQKFKPRAGADRSRLIGAAVTSTPSANR
ncbi:MAG TPA: 6-bladed beta-propeller [Vicinamibacterales bacterium]